MLKKIIAILISLVLLLFSGCYSVSEPMSENNLYVYFIDVGQADCALISLNGNNMLIDGGNVADGDDVIRFIKNLGIDTLHTVVATHAHEDHIGGLSAIIDAFKVNCIYSPVDFYDSQCFSEFKDSAVRQCGITICEKGMSWNVDTAKISVLWSSQTEENTNNTSIVLKLLHNNVSFVFTGDVESDAETKIVNENPDINANILKVGHHGSSTSTSYLFLRSVMPQTAIISCGTDNSYGHPHKETIEKLNQAEVKTYRTDLLGTVKIVSDGNNYTISANSQEETFTPEKRLPFFDIMYIGNKKSKKFHLPSCNGLPKPENMEYFILREEAILKGYSPCGTCKP